MQIRFLRLLVIGGVAVICFAPDIVRAEEGPAQWQPGQTGRVASNINIFEPVSTPLPTPLVTPNPIAAPDLEKPASAQYRPLIDAISRNNSVDPDLIDAMIRTESNYNPWAISSKGARGLMQLIPETGRRFGVQNFFDPQQNIEGGVRYVRYLLDMFGGNVDLSLAAYNAGENLVARLGKIPPIPETRNYVRKIRDVYTKTSTATPVASFNAAQIQVAAPMNGITSNLPVSAKPVQGVPEPLSPRISDRLDERGVHHFSNLEPVN